MRSSVTIFFLLLLFSARSQSKISFEQYSFTGGSQPGILAPVAHYETRQKWYAEARYNYEDFNTFSLYAGHTFSQENEFSWSFTPMIGGMAGRLTGGSFGLNSELSFRKFNFSSESQYCVSASTRYDNFFYNWSEAGITAFDKLRVGISLSRTRLFQSDLELQKGIFAQYSFWKLTAGLFYFNPFSSDNYLIASLGIEF